MLAQIAVIPSAPLSVPELAGPAAVDTEPMRAAVLAAGRALAAAAPRWVALGVADSPGAPLQCATTGDFGGYGVPVPVRLPHPAPAHAAPPPLSMLLAGWLGGQVRPQPESITPFIVDPASSPDECRAAGAEAASEAGCLGGSGDVGLLVIADGATALSPGAPGGGERESAWVVQRALDAAVAAGDAAGLAALSVAECADAGVGTRAAWQVLSGILARRPAAEIDVTYAAAPFGVGYTVATLFPAPPAPETRR
ncbi:hypothetical protein [Gordonia caeni]|uniref:hypothetical protein n=1 Tax=Gordonia caeni TaxID=1007097 RepID=UPI0031D54B52